MRSLWLHHLFWVLLDAFYIILVDDISLPICVYTLLWHTYQWDQLESEFLLIIQMWRQWDQLKVVLTSSYPHIRIESQRVKLQLWLSILSISIITPHTYQHTHTILNYLKVTFTIISSNKNAIQGVPII